MVEKKFCDENKTLKTKQQKKTSSVYFKFQNFKVTKIQYLQVNNVKFSIYYYLYCQKIRSCCCGYAYLFDVFCYYVFIFKFNPRHF